MGEPHQVVIAFPLTGWSFDAFFQAAGKECGRVQRVPLEPNDSGGFLLSPAGFAETYDVTLFGRGPGSLSTTFRWTTPVDGPLAEPKARLAILGGGRRELTGHGIELEVGNLESTPKSAKAHITVTATDGESLSFEASLSRGRCFPEGTLYFDRPDEPARAATELGNPPFTYEVALTLDGTRYRARAVWPRDEIPGNHPSVRLRFSPPLPGLSH